MARKLVLHRDAELVNPGANSFDGKRPEARRSEQTAVNVRITQDIEHTGSLAIGRRAVGENGSRRSAEAGIGKYAIPAAHDRFVGTSQVVGKAEARFDGAVICREATHWVSSGPARHQPVAICRVVMAGAGNEESADIQLCFGRGIILRRDET